MTDVGYETLYGLRGQLAKDGCADSQLVIAKDLLQDQSGDSEENARQGVYWLIRASEQGNEEATVTLQQCLEKGRGITELNFPDVKACLSMSQDEKLARQAARKLFERLSAGEDYITSEQLIREFLRVKHAIEISSSRHRWSFNQLTFGQSSGSGKRFLEGASHDPSKVNGANGFSYEHLSHAEDEERTEAPPEGADWAGRSDPPGEKLSEEHLVSAAVTYAQGELPLVQRMLDLQRPTPALSLNPLLIITHIYVVVIEALGGRRPFIRIPLISTSIQVLLALTLYSLVESIDWYAVVPVALYHGSFMAMIIFTCQMLQNRHEFQQFRVWSGLFLRYSEGNLNPNEAEYQYCKNNLKPYVHFFVALMVNLMMYPLLAPHWTPHSELTVLSSSLMFLSLYAFLNSVPQPLGSRRTSNFEFPQKQPDFLVLFSFAVNVLAKYPYDLDTVVTQSWRYLDVKIPTFPSYVIGHGIEFCLNFRAVFYLLMPAIFFKIAARDRWRGTYRTLIPHCVTLAWWQVAVLTAQGSTWYGLIRAALAVVGVVFFLPLAGLASVLLPLAAAVRMLYLSAGREVLQAAVTILAGTPLLVLLWLRGWHSPQGSRSARVAKAATALQVTLALFAAVLLVRQVVINVDSDSIHSHVVPEAGDRVMSGVSGREVNNEVLAWEQYESMCHKPAWERSTVAHVQQLCSPLEGIRVKWSGYVSNVKVTRVRNPWVEITNRLPAAIGSMVACAVATHGAERSTEDICSLTRYPSPSDQQNCKRILQLSRHTGRCLLTDWDRYDFEVDIKMKNVLWGKSSIDVYLEADDQFQNMSYHLRPGDHIWFSGIMSSLSIHNNGPEPRLQLESMGCLSCERGPILLWEKSHLGFTLTSFFSYVFICVRFILNCLLNPIVILK
ncbi:hypothetical protein ONE63_009630 [Megalurothrips usitatus]|uniref:Wolframin n=1 Tax=Megalurothrips usitatus TaxID=439358 RepID=A0AAV7XJC8_9NEOP|nr:hypothetical protein ONE63_009630 [Megalurothrips usitatus]